MFEEATSHDRNEMKRSQRCLQGDDMTMVIIALQTLQGYNQLIMESLVGLDVNVDVGVEIACR